MMNKITNEFIKSLRPCTDRHLNYLKHYKNTSFTWFEFLNLKNITTSDKIWVFTKKINGVEDLQREFAIRVAVRAVDKVNVPELNDYFTLVLLIIESGDWGLKNLEEYKTADIAADMAADGAASRAACWAASRAAYGAAYWAADYAAYRAAYLAADRTASRTAHSAEEREMQLNILKDIVGV